MSKKVFIFLVLIFFTKCLLGYYLPLAADETYYYIWSLFPRLSYFDHPAMVSWLIYLGGHLVSSHNALAIRILFIFLSTGTLLIWLKLLIEKQATRPQQFAFLCLFVLNPLLGVGSVLATPDVPLVFFWSLSYYCFSKILENYQLKWYLLLGSFLGLGFCSKYHIVLFLIAGIISLIISKKLIKLRPLGVFITILSGFIFSLPVLVWNYNNQWSSFLFQINHGFGRSYYDFEWTWSYVLGQILIMSPFVFLQLFTGSKKSTNSVFSLTQLMFFFTSTFKSVVEANWPIVSQPHALSEFVITSDAKKIRYTFYYWLFIYVTLAVLLTTTTGKALLSNQYTTNDVQEISALPKKYQPLYGPTYQISSLLSWQSQTLVPKLRGFSRKDFFDDLQISFPTEKKFFVLKELGVGWPSYLNAARYEKLESFDNLSLELYQVSYE